MKSRLKRPAHHSNGAKALIPCCYGVVYTITDKVLGVIASSADKILDRLRQIDGVKVVEVHGGLSNLTVPTLRLPSRACWCRSTACGPRRPCPSRRTAAGSGETPWTTRFSGVRKADRRPTESQAPAGE